ncbi:MAG: alpha/beta hydrolase [Acidobacteriota bacterium]
MTRIATALVLLGLAGACRVPQGVKHDRFDVTLGDVQVRAELSFKSPPRNQRLPGVLLVHGGGPADLDHSIRDAAGTLVSANFKTLAEHLAEAGFAVLRHDKRHAQPGGDAAALQELEQSERLADAEAMLEFLRRDMIVDPKRLFVIGQGDGASVAAHLARRHPEVSGLVLISPVVSSRARNLRDQVHRLVLPYLREHSEREDAIGAVGLARALAAPRGEPLTSWLRELTEANDQGARIPHSALDLDHDGYLHFEDELGTWADEVLREQAPGLGRDDLAPVQALAEEWSVPLLILIGESDPVTYSTDVRRFHEALTTAGHVDHSFHRYERLGHTLGEAPSRFLDPLGPIQSAPLADLASWLEERS